MYIAIYVSVIVILCICAIVFFVVKDKKTKKKQEILRKKELEESQNDAQPKIEPVSEENEKTEQIPQPEFEDFSLQLDDTPVKPASSVNLNPFDEFEDVGEENDEDLSYDKYKEYEDFLRKNLDIDTDNDTAETESEMDEYMQEMNESYNNNQDENKADYSQEDLDALKYFDYDSLKGKNEQEILEIINNLPPKARQILMTDILARKDFDDKD